MRMLRPDLAQWALVLPLLVATWALYRHTRAAFRRRAPVAPRFAPLSRRSGAGRDIGVLVLALVMAGALAAALVRPQILITTRVPEYERQDLIVMLDRSASMKAHDIKPSRFARATAELRNLVRHKPEGIDRVALVGFAESSVILSYLTSDMDSLLFYFDWIDQDPTPLLGTNIGAAITSAMEVVKKDDRKTRKLFLILSDGEDYGGELRQALAAARAAGDRINTIGIGSDDAVPIPLRAPDGRETPLKDDEGRPVLTRFSETTLRDVAAETGGHYLRSTTGDELRRAIDEVADRERKIIGYRTSTEYQDVYRVGLAVAAMAGAALWLLI